MTSITLYADVPGRRLVSKDGAPITLPSLVLGDQCVFSLKTLDRNAAGEPRETTLNVRTLRASIGKVLEPPISGAFSVKIGAAVTDEIPIGATTNEVRTALTSIAGYALGEVQASAPGCWLLRFESAGIVPLEVGSNSLVPRSFVRIRPFQINELWWHEIRLIQAPVVFTGSYDRVLPPAPSVIRVRAGSARVEGSSINTNEVQALTVPATFKGTYYLQWDYRSSRLLGIQDGPDEIAAALNAMFTDGRKRFAVTNPEEDKAYIEFVGALEAMPQPLMATAVHSFLPGDLTFVLDLGSAELATALREQSEITLPFEIELEIEDEDMNDPAVAGRPVTFQTSVKIVREQIWEELALVPAVEWLRPPQPRDYLPFTRDQIITGSQHYQATIGNGVAREFVLDHGLNTEALHVTVRENASGGRRLREDEFSVVFTDANSLLLSFPGDQPAPAPGSRAVVVSSAGPISAFQAHHHTIPQVEGLPDALSALGLRIEAIEELLPSVNPTARAGPDTEKSLEIEIPDRAEMFPGKLPDHFDAESAAKDGRDLPKPAGLLPAIHDANVDSIILPLPAAASKEGQVFINDRGSSVMVPGGLGRRGAQLDPNGHVGSDGRVWYRLTRAAATNSFYPVDFERELFMLHINEQMFRPPEFSPARFAPAGNARSR
jgi:hypothetical protein